MSSCSNVAKENNAIYVGENNIKAILNKPKNLVFIWTTWCGVSKELLENTYKHLYIKDSQTNIVIICGNDDIQSIEKIFAKQKISYPIYILEGSSNIFPFRDRQNIKYFINNQFKDPNSLSKLEGSFGIPLTMLIDSNLVILNANMPQDTLGLYTLMKNY